MNDKYIKENGHHTPLCDLADKVFHRLNDEYRLQAEIDNSKIDHSQAHHLSGLIENLLPLLSDDEDLTPPNNHKTRLRD